METILIHARNPGAYTGTGNNTYLIPGTSSTLIDAGPGGRDHLDDLQRELGGSVGLARVLVTHAHPDHAAGAPGIAARWPGAVFAKIPWADEDVRHDVHWQPLADGDLVPAGDGTLRVMHTPGHAPDHACFLDETTGTLFTGDLLVAGGTVVIPASHGGNLPDYLASLRRVIALDPARALPAHGSAIEHPAALAREYIEHRLQRENQVLDALRKGLAAPAQIVGVVYEALPPALFAAACESVLAHLLKLEAEGHARRTGDTWTL